MPDDDPQRPAKLDRLGKLRKLRKKLRDGRDPGPDATAFAGPLSLTAVMTEIDMIRAFTPDAAETGDTVD